MLAPLCLAGPSGRTLAPRPQHRGRPGRLPIVVRASSDNDETRPIFSTFPPTGEATLYDARDAMETCDTLTGEGRRSCYAQFGVDAARVKAWYEPVASLEALWEVSGGGGGASGGGVEGATAKAPTPSTSPVATLDEDEYGGGSGGGKGGSGGGSPAPWWPPLPPLWS